MNNKNIYPLFTILIFALSSCAHKPPKQDLATSTEMDTTHAARDSDSNNADGLKTIHFNFDSYLLTASEKELLKQDSKILKDNKNIRIQIEGHCDKRGSIQYNLALGEKRAHAVKSLLTKYGISSKRISTISYGKEKLLDLGDTEEAHAKNRRANFVITN